MSNVESTAGLTPERLKQLFLYDPWAGTFVRLKKTPGLGRAGPASQVPDKNGYLRIMVDGVRYKAHRLAWLYITGKWPEGVIDHKNRIPSDNRFLNLRDVTQAVNMQNQGRARSNNKSGFLGVSRSHGAFQARIGVDGKHMHLGTFATPQEASVAYLTAKELVHTNPCTAAESVLKMPQSMAWPAEDIARRNSAEL